MKDAIYKEDFSLYVKNLRNLKETFGKIAAETIDATEAIYFSKGIEQDVAYFNKNSTIRQHAQ